MSQQLITALRDCINVMDRELNGLAVIQPELRQAREALTAAEAKPEPWDGEGAPPAGTVCEARMEAEWVRVQVMYLSRHTALLRFFTDDGADCEGAYSPKDCQFRPIRTPEQIAEVERRSSIATLVQHICADGAFDVDDPEVAAAASKIYDAGYRKQVEPTDGEDTSHMDFSI